MSKIIVILINVGYVCMVSALVSLPSLFFGLSVTNYFSWFVVTAGIQLFLGKLWNYFVDRRVRLKIAQVNSANALAEAVQLLKVTCSYCGTANLAKIYIGEDNTYDCDACKQTNSVQISTTSARVTKPIMPKAELAGIFNDLDNKEK